jgi:hypothetical protein
MLRVVNHLEEPEMDVMNIETIPAHLLRRPAVLYLQGNVSQS